MATSRGTPEAVRPATPTLKQPAVTPPSREAPSGYAVRWRNPPPTGAAADVSEPPSQTTSGRGAQPDAGAAAAGTRPAGAGTLIAFDWGTSNLRAFVIDDEGAVLEQRRRPWGILRLPDRSVATRPDREITPFEAAAIGIAGDWIQRWPDARLLACGMVGSRQGWREAPYLAVPAEPADIARARVEVEVLPGRSLAILPGLCQGGHTPATRITVPARALEAPDGMRGEETQAVGALAREPAIADDGWLVLPGTHSKWVRVRQGRLVGFTTHMTGELFDVLYRHTILAQSMTGASEVPEVPEPLDDHSDETRHFEYGVRLAADSGASLPNLLFGIRARTLLQRLTPDSARGLLSGLLIGHECQAATAERHHALAPLVLVGEPALAARYGRALGILGLPPHAILDNTAADGLYRISRTLRP